MITVEELRAELNRTREIAMARFEKDWGTRDVRKVGEALARAIPGSTGPGDAAAKALRMLRAG